MRIALLVGFLAVLTTACGGAAPGAPSGEPQAASPDAAPAPTTPDGEDASTGLPDAPAGDIDAGQVDAAPASDVDASAPDAADAPDAQTAKDLAKCRLAACQNSGSNCGTLANLCGGVPVDCGKCAAGYLCGDNGHVNVCGYYCQDTGLENFCTSNDGSVPNAHAFAVGCHSPYWYEYGPSGSKDVLVMRPGGIAGCVDHTPPGGMTILCCP